METKIKRVGFWFNEQDCNKDFPMPVPREVSSIKRTHYNAKECEPGSLEDHGRFVHLLAAVESMLMVNYFDKNFQSKFVVAYRGYSICRVCGIHGNGYKEFIMEFGGVQYHWPEGYRHYLEEHYVEPDPDFKDFIESLVGTYFGCCYRLSEFEPK